MGVGEAAGSTKAIKAPGLHDCGAGRTRVPNAWVLNLQARGNGGQLLIGPRWVSLRLGALDVGHSRSEVSCWTKLGHQRGCLSSRKQAHAATQEH